MKILVTGGAGFIGSNFIRYIFDRYPAYEIINLDKLTYCGNTDNLKDVAGKRGYRFVQGDIGNGRLVEKVMRGVDAVVNFAAETHVDRSISTADTFIETNVKGVHVLLETARQNRVKRFVQVSTDEVYGSIDRGSFTEKSPLSPNSPYSAAKAAGDLLARSYFVTYKLPVIVTRSSNNFGPYQYPEKVVPLFITNALENQPLPLYGDGKNVRDWLYVMDNCEAIDLALRRGKPGEIYNIGGGNEKTNIELTRRILQMLDKPRSLIRKVIDRPGHDRRYSVDCGKIRKELGWTSGADFEAALQSTIDWYRDNERWWKKLKNKEFRTYYRKQYKI